MINKLIDACVRCTKCGVQGFGNCDCWTKKLAKPKKAKAKQALNAARQEGETC